MESITERDIKEAVRSNAVKYVRIQQLENGRYSLIVKLTWRKAEQTLITQRNGVRGWVDLDRLLNHIKDDYGIHSAINVTLFGESK